MSDSDSDAGGAVDFAAIDSQAHASMSMEEANKLHRQKIMALMRSNDLLRKEVRQLKKEGQDNYRVKQIKNLRQQLRETQAISDELTRTLMNKSQMSKEDIGELYDEILSQPKLAKPNNPVKLKKDVLVLQQDRSALERELAATKRLLREYRSGERRMEADGEVMRSAQPAVAPSDSALAEELRQVRLAHAVVQGELDTKDRVISLHREMVSKLQQENRELQSMRAQWDELEMAKRAAEHESAQTRQQMLSAMGSNEEYHQDIRELRTKLATLLGVRDRVEQAHAEKVASMKASIEKIQQRELQLRGQIQLLKADLKSSQDAVVHYKAKAAEAKAAAAESERKTASDAVWEVQTKLSVVLKELQERTTELRVAQAALKSSGRNALSTDLEKALRDRVAQVSQDNARLTAALDSVERRYIVHNEELSRALQEKVAVESKYHALLREMDERAGRFDNAQSMLNTMQGRLTAAEEMAQYQASQLAQLQAQREADRTEKEQADNTIQQLQKALQERAAFDGNGAGGAGGPSMDSMTARSNASSSDDLFPPARGGAGAAAAASLSAQLKRAEEAHLEHVAKLMRTYDAKEREMLYQIARLQEQIRPGSGNRVHLAYRNTAAAAHAHGHAQGRPGAGGHFGAKTPFNIDTSSDEEDEDDD